MIRAARAACGVALSVIVGGCVALPETGARPMAEGRLIPAATGLDVAGTGREIGFGRAEFGAIDSVSAVLGMAPQAPGFARACPAGGMTVSRWPLGLSLFFQDGDFRGWLADAPTAGPAANDWNIGSVADLTGAEIRETRQGREAERDGVTALLAEDGRVAALWAGSICPGA